MEETPALISRPTVYAGFATASLILGIVGVVIPFLGLILGILAVIFGIVALVHKTTHKVPAIIGIISGGLAIIWTVAIIALFQLFAAGNLSFISLFPPSDRDKVVAALVNEKKDFNIGETAKIGSSNVIITKFERNYIPTTEDLAKIEGRSAPKEVLPSSKRSALRGVLKEDEVEYVLVQGQTKGNGSASLGNDGFVPDELELNYVEPYTVDQQVVEPTDSAYSGPQDGYQSFSSLYRIRSNSSKLTMYYSDTIYTRVSPIVGTEGAPQQTLKYTIALN